MPNHVTNIITASPAVIDAITRHHTPEEKEEMWSEKLKNAAAYKARSGKDWPYAATDDARMEARFVDFSMVIPEPPNLEQGGCNGTHEPGIICWYRWNVEAWGTKWNGYETTVEPIEGDLCRLTFDTAWSHPEPVIDALSMKFPEETLAVEFADEDLGSNLGSYKIKGGDVFDIEQPDYSDDPDAALAMAVRIKYGQTLEEYKAERLRDDLDSAWRWVARKRIEAATGEDPGWGLTDDQVPDDIKESITTSEQADDVWNDGSEILQRLLK